MRIKKLYTMQHFQDYYFNIFEYKSKKNFPKSFNKFSWTNELKTKAQTALDLLSPEVQTVICQKLFSRLCLIKSKFQHSPAYQNDQKFIECLLNVLDFKLDNHYLSELIKARQSSFQERIKLTQVINIVPIPYI